MVSRYARAEVLGAIWRLGAADIALPLHGGILDRALKDCFARLPVALTDGLFFGVTSVGLRCYELPDLILAGQELEMFEVSGATGNEVRVTLTYEDARVVVVHHGMSTAAGVEAGASLMDALGVLSAEQYKARSA